MPMNVIPNAEGGGIPEILDGDSRDSSPAHPVPRLSRTVACALHAVMTWVTPSGTDTQCSPYTGLCGTVLENDISNAHS